MALIKCPECGKEISDKAKACIHCGYPIEENDLIYPIKEMDCDGIKEYIVNVNILEKFYLKKYNRWLLSATKENNPQLGDGIFVKGEEVLLLDNENNEVCKHRLNTYVSFDNGNKFTFGLEDMNSNLIEKVSVICKITKINPANLIVKQEEKVYKQVKCPKCGSFQIQAVPRKWSLATGLLTNKVDRVCLNCKNKF